jgi:hypothetical protein
MRMAIASYDDLEEDTAFDSIPERGRRVLRFDLFHDRRGHDAAAAEAIGAATEASTRPGSDAGARAGPDTGTPAVTDAPAHTRSL